jgi:hypothetical protein
MHDRAAPLTSKDGLIRRQAALKVYVSRRSRRESLYLNSTLAGAITRDSRG